MKMYRFFFQNVVLLFLTLSSCTQEKRRDLMQRRIVEHQLQDLSQKLTNLETTDSLNTFLKYYDDLAIVMPEYQLTLRGRDEIKSFYREIFNRQNIVTFQRQPLEFIHMDNAIVEIGTFKKEFTDSKTDTLLSLDGKYWMVWQSRS